MGWRTVLDQYIDVEVVAKRWKWLVYIAMRDRFNLLGIILCWPQMRSFWSKLAISIRFEQCRHLFEQVRRPIGRSRIGVIGNRWHSRRLGEQIQIRWNICLDPLLDCSWLEFNIRCIFATYVDPDVHSYGLLHLPALDNPLLRWPIGTIHDIWLTAGCVLTNVWRHVCSLYRICCCMVNLFIPVCRSDSRVALKWNNIDELRLAIDWRRSTCSMAYPNICRSCCLIAISVFNH